MKENRSILREKEIKFATAVDLIVCQKQINFLFRSTPGHKFNNHVVNVDNLSRRGYAAGSARHLSQDHRRQEDQYPRV